jgi:hypothetical protein
LGLTCDSFSIDHDMIERVTTNTRVFHLHTTHSPLHSACTAIGSLNANKHVRGSVYCETKRREWICPQCMSVPWTRMERHRRHAPFGDVNCRL